MSKKSHHFLTLWPWPLTYDLEKLIRSGHYHYQCVYQIWEQSIPWFLSYRVNTIAGGGRLRRKTITSPDPSDTGDINIHFQENISKYTIRSKYYAHDMWLDVLCYDLEPLNFIFEPKFELYPYPLRLLHWHWGNHVIVPVSTKQPWRKRVNKSHGFIENQ